MKISLPDIPESEKTPRVTELLGIIERLFATVVRQQEDIQILKDEISELKGLKKSNYSPARS